MMNGNEFKECPFCREKIRAEAKKCRYCKSALRERRLQFRDGGCRDVRGRMLAGVCGYLARALGLSVTVVRLAFLLGALFVAPLTLIVYAAVWIIVPFRSDERSFFERCVDEARRLYKRFREEPEGWDEQEKEAGKEQNGVVYPPVPVDNAGVIVAEGNGRS